MRGRLPQALMYHYVRHDDASPAVGYRALSPSVLEAQLDAIGRIATPVAWTAVAATLRDGPPLPDDAVLLTFDDGLRDHHDVVLPRLVARGLPAIFFVLARDPGDGLTVGHRVHILLGTRSAATLRDQVLGGLARAERLRYASLERDIARTAPADPDDAWKRPLQRELAPSAGPILRSLVEATIGPEPDIAAALYLDERGRADLVAAGMTLGGHGREHPWLDHVGPAALDREVAHSAALLARHASGPWPFAYPYGGVPERAGTVLRRHGFAAAFTTASRSTGRFHVGRHDGDEIGAGPLDAWIRRR